MPQYQVETTLYILAANEDEADKMAKNCIIDGSDAWYGEVEFVSVDRVTER